jgi:endonuclease-3
MQHEMKSLLTHFETLFGAEPRCELNYSSDIELLVAILLSAQCTDQRVNRVTKSLFAKYKTIDDFANADRAELEKEIYSTGFFRNKAKNIIALCNKLKTDFAGAIPDDVDTLERLPGIGRKTASVFVAEFHKKPAIAVDTHVTRVSNRLGMTKSQNPRVIEKDLSALCPQKDWARFHLYMVLFGRYICTAKKPKCDTCVLRDRCCAWRGG